MARKQAQTRQQPDEPVVPADSDAAAAYARDCLETARTMQQAMLAAVAEQQRGHQEQLAETARLCREILHGPDAGKGR